MLSVSIVSAGAFSLSLRMWCLERIDANLRRPKSGTVRKGLANSIVERTRRTEWMAHLWVISRESGDALLAARANSELSSYCVIGCFPWTRSETDQVTGSGAEPSRESDRRYWSLDLGEEKAASAGPCWAFMGPFAVPPAEGRSKYPLGIPGRAERHPLTDGACEGTQGDSPVRDGALVVALPNQHRAGVAKLLWMAGRSVGHGLVQVSPVSGHTYPPLSWPEIEVPQPHNGRLPDPPPGAPGWVGWLAGWDSGPGECDGRPSGQGGEFSWVGNRMYAAAVGMQRKQRQASNVSFERQAV